MRQYLCTFMIWAQMRILFQQNEQTPVKRTLCLNEELFSTHGNHLAIFSPAIYLGWMPDQQVMSIRQLENQISRARVQNRNFMRLHNDTDYLRELCGWLRIPWFWLRKNNTLQRANMGKQTQISTNECKLNMCEFRSHLLLQKPDERVKCTRIVSWVQSRDINCTTDNLDETWWNLKNVSAYASDR